MNFLTVLLTLFSADPVSIPDNFAKYFERADKANAILTRQYEDLIVICRGRVDSEPKLDSGKWTSKESEVARLNSLKQGLEELKSDRPFAMIPDKPTEGDIGRLKDVSVSHVYGKNVAAGGYAYAARKRQLAVFVYGSIAVKRGDYDGLSEHAWVVTKVAGAGANADDFPENLRIAVRGCSGRPFVVLERINKPELRKFHDAYRAGKKPVQPGAAPVQLPVAENPLEEPLPAEFRTYFERANATQKEMAESYEKRIAKLTAEIGDVQTLPVKKKELSQELILVRAKLASSKKSNAIAFLRAQPALGDLCALQNAKVAAIHDGQSVIASMTDGRAVRFTGVDPKSLKMRVGVTVDEEAVWQVVNVD